MIEAVGIVVPAKDEERSIAECIEALELAREQLPRRIETRLVLVLDACSDRTRKRAERELHRPHHVLEVEYANVGKSRAHGARVALAHLARYPLSQVWLATTDADSCVSRSWLVDHVDVADAGADALAGTVEIRDWSHFTLAEAKAFTDFYETYARGGAHGHVHGSNLGFRADAYLSAGGFLPMRTGEDHALWNALASQGARMVSRRDVVVTTSSRIEGRAPDGFAGFLGALRQRVT